MPLFASRDIDTPSSTASLLERALQSVERDSRIIRESQETLAGAINRTPRATEPQDAPSRQPAERMENSDRMPQRDHQHQGPASREQDAGTERIEPSSMNRTGILDESAVRLNDVDDTNPSVTL